MRKQGAGEEGISWASCEAVDRHNQSNRRLNGFEGIHYNVDLASDCLGRVVSITNGGADSHQKKHRAWQQCSHFLLHHAKTESCAQQLTAIQWTKPSTSQLHPLACISLGPQLRS